MFTPPVGDSKLLLAVTEFSTVLMQHVNSEHHTSNKYPNHFSTGFPDQSVRAGSVFVVMLTRRIPPGFLPVPPR